jgi:hypothetical protein
VERCGSMVQIITTLKDVVQALSNDTDRLLDYFFIQDKRIHT